MKRKNQKAFTLIELLIVIAIIAVLATVVILSLNPAELLRQARDSNRVSDMATYKSAIALYLADQSAPNLGTAGTCYASVNPGAGWYIPNSSTNTAWTAMTTTTCYLWMAGTAGTTAASGSSLRGITGGGVGWVPINFSAISAGSPIGQEPVDPVNQATSSAGQAGCTPSALSSCGLFYSYDFSGTTYKTAAFMESSKYSASTTGVEGTDGGNSVTIFESGSTPTL